MDHIKASRRPIGKDLTNTYIGALRYLGNLPGKVDRSLEGLSHETPNKIAGLRSCVLIGQDYNTHSHTNPYYWDMITIYQDS